MRTEFHTELADLSATLVDMANEVRDAMRRATRSLLNADAALAEGVIAGDVTVNGFRRQVEERVFAVLARQAPVASDLRLVISAIHVAIDLERMGDFAKHVAKVALRRAPVRAIPDELVSVIEQMNSAADRIAAKIGAVLANPAAASAAQLELDDDEMDELHKGMFVVLLGAAWKHGVEQAIDGALLGRFYERFADHAVNAGRQMYFFVTGNTLT